MSGLFLDVFKYKATALNSWDHILITRVSVDKLDVMSLTHWLAHCWNAGRVGLAPPGHVRHRIHDVADGSRVYPRVSLQKHVEGKSVD